MTINTQGLDHFWTLAAGFRKKWIHCYNIIYGIWLIRHRFKLISDQILKIIINYGFIKQLNFIIITQ